MIETHPLQPRPVHLDGVVLAVVWGLPAESDALRTGHSGLALTEERKSVYWENTPLFANKE